MGAEAVSFALLGRGLEATVNPEDDGGLSAVAFRLRQGFGGQVAKAEAALRFHSEFLGS
jgi:hypothetical protein